MIPATFAENYKLLDRFDTTYWSGKDVDVYVGNVYMDEAVQVHYEVVERVVPYFHYSDYVPTRFHHGTRMITGEITVNFKQSGYIFSLLEVIRNGSRPERIKEVQQPAKFSSAYDTGANFNPQNADPSAIQNYIKSYKKANEERDVNVQKTYGTPARVPNNRGMFETGLNGFDIQIIFGGHIGSASVLKYGADNHFVEKNSYYTDGAPADPTTGRKILGVEIMGSSMAIDDSGRPVMETFTFHAKSIVPISGEGIKGLRDA